MRTTAKRLLRPKATKTSQGQHGSQTYWFLKLPSSSSRRDTPAKTLRATCNRCTNVYKTALQRNVAAILAEMPGIGIRAKEKLQTRDRTDTKLQASSLHLPSIKHVKRAKTAQLRASAHDYLKKTPRLGSQSILPSTSFALAQQASSREYSTAFTKDDDDTTSLFY